MPNFKNSTTDNTQYWTTERLVSFSTNMARAFFPGMNQPELLDAQSEDWTTEQLIGFSKSMARAFCPGC